MTGLPAEPLTVLVVSWDASFRRVAGAALSRAGHQVHVAAATNLRLERLIRLRRPDVLVLDISAGAVPPTSERLSRRNAPAGIVLVAEHATASELEKWGPLETLVAAVEDAATPQTHLRLVTDDG